MVVETRNMTKLRVEEPQPPGTLTGHGAPEAGDTSTELPLGAPGAMLPPPRCSSGDTNPHIDGVPGAGDSTTRLPLGAPDAFLPPPRSTRTRSSSSSLAAQRLATEVEFARCKEDMERRKLDLLLLVESRKIDLAINTADTERRAKLATLDSRSGSQTTEKTARIRQWLNEANLTLPQGSPENPIPPYMPITDNIIPRAPPNTPSFSQMQEVPARELCAQNVPMIKKNTLIGSPTTNTAGGDPVTVSTLVEALETFSQCKQSKKGHNIKLPHYDGKSYTEYLAFKRAFVSSLNEYSDAENISRLSYALHGAAREAVSALLVTAREPAQVLHQLDQRFDRPDLILLQEINSVRALPRVTTDDDLSNFSCRVRNCVEIVKLLGNADYLRSPELFNSLLSKLPTLLRPRWLDFAVTRESLGEERLVTLAAFLSREVQLQTKFGFIDKLAPSTSNRPYESGKQRDNAHPFASLGQRFSKEAKNNIKNTDICDIKSSCLLCKNKHKLYQCDTFKKYSVDDRWQFIIDNKICRRCLKNTPHRFCDSKELCDKGCIPKHHKLLHKQVEKGVFAHVGGYDSEHDDDSSYSGDVGDFTDHFDKNSSVRDVQKSPSGSGEPFEKAASSFSPTAVDHAQTNTNTSGMQKQFRRALLKIIAVTVTGPSGNFDTYALLDDASSATFIDSEISSHIGADGPEGQLHMDCVGGLSRETKVTYVNFQIKGRYSNDLHDIKRARSINNLGLSGQTVCKEDIGCFPYLSNLQNELCYPDATPKIIIGADNCHLLLSQDTRKGTKNQPVAIKTALGWVLFGFVSSKTKKVEFVNHISTNDFLYNTSDFENTESSLDSLVIEQYKLDAVGITKKTIYNSDEKRAIEILENTASRLPNGHFEIGLLWKADHLTVPNSYPLAVSRFLSLEKKMAKDSNYARWYKNNIRDILDKEYAEICQDVQQTSPIYWYLPHFGVTNPNKPGKLRVVHDAAATVQNVSLNSMLLTGPDLLQPVFNVLLRFREEKVGMTADIREMFPQIKIINRDRDAQRFIWRENPNEPLRTYRMSSMIFGAASSPFTALYIKNKNALDMQNQYPDAARAIIFDHYMDDYIGSVQTTKHAAQLAADIVTVHKNAGFEMRGWVSNDPTALTLLPKELIRDQTTDPVDLGHLNTPVRALGLIWQPDKDVISFNTGTQIKTSTLPERLTKRVALSHIMRVYDPLGILAPIIVRGRILFQNVWRKSIEWDHELPQEDKIAFGNWYHELTQVSKLKIPRHYNTSETDILERELHILSDASELSYAAVAYWRFIYADGNVKLALICSRARVAPLKPTSIPRLELQGAVIAARLSSSISEAHRWKPTRRFFWCDSMTVLGWLRNDARTFKPFVAHRVADILEHSDVNEWRWIPSNLNVADDATRIKSGSLTQDSRWIVGPQFLFSQNWPKEPESYDSQGQDELKPTFRRTKKSLIKNPYEPIRTSPTKDKAHLFALNSESISMPVAADSRRLSSWLKLVRATALAHSFISLLRYASFQRRGMNLKKTSLSDVAFLTKGRLPLSRKIEPVSQKVSYTVHLLARDLNLAEVHILRQSQEETFKDEITCLHTKKPIHRSSRLYRLAITMDDKNLICLSTRIAAAPNIPVEMKKPIILDGKHPSVQLLIKSYHNQAAHANTETVVNELRQRYWILHLRSSVRSVIHHCQYCHLQRSVPLQPLMGDLPEIRLAHHKRPFTFVGLDYFGPVQVAIGRRREKRYVALYTCLVIRAVHFEIVNNLSADSAIMSFRRFIARRGCPSEIVSDNGTAFVGANNILTNLYNPAVQDFAANQRVKWSFIPPSAPFMGGAWERLVRSAKTALKVTLHERTPSEEIFTTLLAEAEALINSRPLVHISTDPEDPEALTPSHFLIGMSSGRPLTTTLTDRDLLSRSSWRKAQRLADHFWQRWVTEYLPTLSPRRIKATDSSQNLKVGDLVFIADGNLPRGSWPRGRITKTYPGRDGIVRVADVCTSAGTLRRPVKKLVPLALNRGVCG